MKWESKYSILWLINKIDEQMVKEEKGMILNFFKLFYCR